MYQITCNNCKQTTKVDPPKYRCKICNYPLKKYVVKEEEKSENKIVIDIQGGGTGSGSAKDKVEKTIQDIIIQKNNNDDKPQELNEKFSTQKDKKDGNYINIDFGSPKPKEEPKPEPKPEPVVNISKKETVKDLIEDKPYVKGSDSEIIMKENKNPEKEGEVVAGWVVVHTENRDHVTYELFVGDNVIGRPDGPHHVDIKIDEDPYVSRIHSFIKVTKDTFHRFRYEIFDDGSLRGGVPSTNGTFVNTHKVPDIGGVFLKDGDTIQVGETKLVFKNTDTAVDYYSAAQNVQGSDYTETVNVKGLF